MLPTEAGSTFSIFTNFYDIEIIMQIELLRFGGPHKSHSRLWLVHIYHSRSLLQSPLYTKHLHFDLKVCFITRLQTHLSEFSWFCMKMLPALGGEHYFAPLPSLGGGLNSPPNAYWDLFLLTWQAISRPIILLPAAAGSIISIFGQKRTKKSHSVFLLFPLLKISVQILWFFNHFSKKRFLPRCRAHFWKACARTQLPKRLSHGSD